MRPGNRREVIRYYHKIVEKEPIVVMTFDPPQAGVFDSEDALDKALNKKTIQKAYTVLNELKEEAYDRLSVNKLAPTKKVKVYRQKISLITDSS